METIEVSNEKALKALEQIKTYCAATNLDELNYVIKILKKLQCAGVTKPLEADFSLLTEKKNG
ncbi:MAG: hypothetical protein II811_02675 [Spirochaetaceae bacterium]|nr:hypothetical protein [Spirochaetaceae bacterium]